MKILALSYLFPNPQQPTHGIFVFNRLKAIARHHDVIVIAPIPWFPFKHKLSHVPDLHKVPYVEKVDSLLIYHPRFFVVPHILKFLDAFTYLLCTLPLLIWLLFKESFDIIDLHWVYPDILTALTIASITNRPIVVTIRGKEALCYGEKSWRKRLIDYWLKKTDWVICLSQELAELVNDIGVDSKKIDVVRNGVDVSRFRPMSQEICRRELGIPSDKRVIVSIGAIIESKGFQRIIECMPELLSEHVNVFLYIIGAPGPEGNYMSTLRALIERLGLMNNVFLVGARPNNELPLWYNAADVFCFASSTEGSPNVVMESLATGCPVIASAVGGIPDILIEDFLGKLFYLGDHNGLRTALKDFFRSEWDRDLIHGYMEQYTWDWCASLVQTVYNKVLL